MTSLKKISDILGLTPTETQDTFILDLQKITKKAQALDVESQFIKCIDTLGSKGLDSGYVIAFPNKDADLKTVLENHAEKYKGKKIAVLVATLRKDYPSYKLDKHGEKVKIEPKDAQPKQYKVSKRDEYTNFYSVKYINSIIKDTDYKLELFETKSMINLGAIYIVPSAKKKSKK